MKTLDIKKIMGALLLITGTLSMNAQDRDSVTEKTVWDKKFLIGATFNNGIVTFSGNALAQEYFLRPSIGGALKAEFYFTPNIGLTAGLGFQVKGAGMITPDKVKGLGNSDSTFRARIKMYNLEIPIAIVFRGFEVIKGTRLHAELGISPSKILNSEYVFLSVEDGFHLIEDHSNRYYKSDLFINTSIGIDINAATSCIFQVHLYGNWGTQNVYEGSAFPNKDGRNNLYGIKLGWLF